MQKKPLFNRNENKQPQPSQADPRMPTGFTSPDQSFAGGDLNNSRFSLPDSPISMNRDRELALENQTPEDSF